MKVCVFYTSPKLGDIILQLPFIKAISVHFNKKVTLCINQNINIQNILQKQNYIDSVIVNPFRRGRFFLNDVFKLSKILKQKVGSVIAFFGTIKACKDAKNLKPFKAYFECRRNCKNVDGSFAFMSPLEYLEQDIDSFRKQFLIKKPEIYNEIIQQENTMEFSHS